MTLMDIGLIIGLMAGTYPTQTGEGHRVYLI